MKNLMRFIKKTSTKVLTLEAFLQLQYLSFTNNLAYAIGGDLKQPPQISVTGGGNTQTSATATENGTQVTTTGAINQYLTSFRSGVLLVLGAAILLSLAALTYCALKVANSGDNPVRRRSAISGLGIALISIAILGALSWIAGLAYNTL